MKLRNLLLGSLVLSASLSAQTTATFYSFGYGCDSCLSSNSDALSNTLRQGTLPNEYSYGYTAPRAMMITGFSMYTQSTTGGLFTMDTALYRESTTTADTPDDVAVETGKMTADTAVGWYATKFANPVSVASGEKFWVSGLDSSSILASSVVGGTATTLPIYWRRTGTAWARTGIISNPGIVIFCDEVPVLTATNTPKLNSVNFSIDIDNAPSNSIAFLVLGVSNTTGPLGPLPSDLGVIGFTGCTLWSSNEFTLNGFTTTTGDYSWLLPLPNDPSLDNLPFYTQAYVVDSNGGAVSFSNAGAGRLGTL